MREKLEITRAILETSRVPHRKTHIMYKTNLTHKQVSRYLNMLMSKEMLERKGNVYMTTVAGEIFVEGLNILLDMWHEQEPIEQTV